jgi:hypothetical protein
MYEIFLRIPLASQSGIFGGVEKRFADEAADQEPQ